jgi:plastocyanin
MKVITRLFAGLLSVSLTGSVVNPFAQPTADLHGSAHVEGRPDPDTVVWLEAPNAPPQVQKARVVLDQRNLSFSPRILVVRAGTTVDFPNNDRVFHNVFSFRDGKRFDLGMYPVGTLRRVVFDRPGLSRIFCNIHPNMAAYVITVDSPYFARADESGAFTIADVPPGLQHYRAWRPGAVAELSGTWTPADRSLTLTWP